MNKMRILWCKHNINSKFCIKCKPTQSRSIRPKWAEIAIKAMAEKNTRRREPMKLGTDYFTTIDGI